jgi:eukaryotic-like serine/threonine-protein kinase
VIRLLATDPQDRYSNAAELLEELGRVRDGLPPVVPSPNEATTAALGDPMAPVPAPPASGSVGTAYSRRLSRRPLWILTVLAMLFALLGVLGWDLSRTTEGVGAVRNLEGGPLGAPATVSGGRGDDRGKGTGSAIPSEGVAGGASTASASASVSASASASAPSSATPAPGDSGSGGSAAQEQYR